METKPEFAGKTIIARDLFTTKLRSELSGEICYRADESESNSNPVRAANNNSGDGIDRCLP